MSDDLSGRTLGRYQVLERLGRGGMAEVYRAYQPSLDRYVAIKVIYPHLASDGALLDRFGREARAVAALRHPNIVQVHDFDVQAGVAFMAMEYIDGPTLKAALQSLHRRGRLLPPPVVGQIVGQLADALAYAHEQQLVHRDMKPANVLLRRRAPADTPLDDAAVDALVQSLGPTSVVLTDFGVARIIKDSVDHTAAGTILGSPAYMSPEQGRGERVDYRSDIYSLGVVLYELLTGQVPFDADTPFAIVLKHTTAPLPPPRSFRPDLPEGIERVVLKALAKDPADRYQDAAAFGAAVRQECARWDIGPDGGLIRTPVATSNLAPDAFRTRVVETTAPPQAAPRPPAAPPPAPVTAAPPARPRRRIGCWIGGGLLLLATVAVVAVVSFFAGGAAVFKGLGQAGALVVPTELAEAATAAAEAGSPFPFIEGTATPPTGEELAALSAADAACPAPGCPGGSGSEAVQILDAALAARPESPVLLAARALAYTRWDPYTYGDQIESDIEEAVSIDPLNPMAHMAAGMFGAATAESDDERAEALEALNRAVELAPDLAAARLARAAFLAESPDYYGERSPTRDQVIADASAVLVREPQNTEALALRGQAYYNASQPDLALADADALLAVAPADPRALSLRADLYRYYLGDPEEALASYAALIAAYPDDIGALSSRAALLSELGRSDEARADYDALVERDRANPEHFALRGFLLLTQEDPAAALADFEQALLIAGEEFAPARAGRGSARLAQGDAAGAVDDLEFAAGRPDDLGPIWGQFYGGRAVTLADLARAYIQLDRADDARATLDSLVELQGDWYLPYLLRGRLLREAGDREAARADLRRALELAAADAERREVEDELRLIP